jgi:hypothetical protein
MPYKVKAGNNEFFVVNSETEKVMGSHKTRGEAMAQMRALYEAEPEAGKSMNLSYAKSLGIEVPEMAVKYMALNEIKGYTFLWGGPKMTDIEAEYFTKDSNFWDTTLGKSARPLTWDHAQDEEFKAAHKYRKAIDALIEAGKLGTSSDSAPQYVQRVKTGKSTWLKEWPWFASALTDAPAEPRMVGSLEFFKSLGVTLPDMQTKTAWEFNQRRIQILKLKQEN